MVKFHGRIAKAVGGQRPLDVDGLNAFVVCFFFCKLDRNTGYEHIYPRTDTCASNCFDIFGLVGLLWWSCREVGSREAGDHVCELGLDRDTVIGRLGRTETRLRVSDAPSTSDFHFPSYITISIAAQP